MPENAKSCINCGLELNSNFCPNCGQKTQILPITWKGLATELSSRWIGLDNRIVRTFKNLWVRPNIVVDEYLAGNRVKYIGPLSYLIVMSALYILSFNIFGVTTEEFLADSAKNFQTTQVDENQQKFMEDYMNTIASNMRLVVAALIPFLALSMIIFYDKRNYLQNFLVVAYATSQMLWLSILFVGIFALTGYNPQYEGLVINLTYYVWVIGSINPQESKVMTYMKSFFTWMISYIFFIVAVSIIAFVWIVVVLTSTS